MEVIKQLRPILVLDFNEVKSSRGLNIDKVYDELNGRFSPYRQNRVDTRGDSKSDTWSWAGIFFRDDKSNKQESLTIAITKYRGIDEI